MSHKVSYMDKKIMMSLSISRRTIVLLEERSERLRLSKHRVVEELILQWIKDTKNI